MDNQYFIAGMAWLIPGAGHFLLNRRWQALVLFGGTVILLITGLMLGGIYYPGSPADYGIMYWLHQTAGAGNAAFLLLNLIFKENLNSTAAQQAFSSATFEYAGRCLALAGLLNYLAILDVFDILYRRK